MKYREKGKVWFLLTPDNSVSSFHFNLIPPPSPTWSCAHTSGIGGFSCGHLLHHIKAIGPIGIITKPVKNPLVFFFLFQIMHM